MTSRPYTGDLTSGNVKDRNMMHYQLTLQEHLAKRGSYVDPDRYREGHRDYHPEMLCRTGDGHARGTRIKGQVTCDRCLAALAGEPGL